MGVFDNLRQILQLGVDPKELDVLPVCVRAVIVFLSAIVMGRLADKRFWPS